MTNQSATPGMRTITPEAIAGRRAAAEFAGLPAGMDEGNLIQVIRRGAPRCGFSPAEVRRLVYLVRHTRSGDWRDADGLPVVWKSVSTMAGELGISRRQVNAVERSLADKGAIAHKDSASRRRWGRRDAATGSVTEAYGVDLRPLAHLCQEFADAAMAAEEDKRIRKAVRDESLALRCEIRRIAAALGRECDLGGRPLEMTAARIAHLAERDRLLAMRDALIAEFPDLRATDTTAVCASETGTDEGCGGIGCGCRESALPSGDEGEVVGRGGGGFRLGEGEANLPHILIHSESVTNGNRPARSDGAADPGCEASTDGPSDLVGDKGPGRNQIDPERDFGVQHLQPGRVAAAAGDAFLDLTGGDAGWRDLRWAAEVRRESLGIHDRAWNRAVRVLGRRAAAVLVAIIDGRCQDKASFVWNPSGFVVGCVKQAEVGGLHLHRSVWGLERTGQWKSARWAYAGLRPAGEAVR